MEGEGGHEERSLTVGMFPSWVIEKNSVCSVLKYVITFMSCLKSVIPTSAVWILIFL